MDIANQEPVTLPEYIEKIYPQESRWNEISLGVGVDGEVSLNLEEFGSLLLTGTTGSGKSIIERNFIYHAVNHPNYYEVYGIDLKKVELRPYLKGNSHVVKEITTTLETSLVLLEKIRQEMIDRFERNDSYGVSGSQQDISSYKHILFVIDEAYQLLAPEGVNTEEGRHNDRLHLKAQEIVFSLVSLGQYVGIHLIMGTQRPYAKIFSKRLKDNVKVRIAAGRMDSVASAMTLDNDNATLLPSIRGRGCIQVHGVTQEFQGYFVKPTDV